MKIGFAIISHQTPGLLFEKLLSRLVEFPDHKIVIHHDLSQTPFDDAMLTKYGAELTDKFHKTAWCSMGVIKGTFECLKQLRDVDWIVLLSANDYPVAKVDLVVDFLKDTKFNAFVDGVPVTHNKNKWELLNWIYDGVFKKTIAKIPSISKKGKFKWRKIKIKKSSEYFNENYRLHFGSQWFMIDKKVADYLLTIDLKTNPVVKFLSESEICKDETIFQTLIYNNPDFNISKDTHRYINWENAEKQKLWHPNILDTNYLAAIKESRAFFARKFKLPESSAVISEIDKLISK